MSTVEPSSDERDGRTFQCADCGKVELTRLMGGTGYSTDAKTGEKRCYACTDKRERAFMGTVDRFTGYLSSDGREFQTWSGGTLGTVVHSKPCKLTRISFTHDRHTYRSVRVRALDGSVWYGRGSPGIVLTLRRSVGAAR